MSEASGKNEVMSWRLVRDVGLELGVDGSLL